MRILKKGQVYLICRPQIVEAELTRFLTDNDLRWPTDHTGETDADRLIEIAGRNCFDDQTEIMTTEGWKLFSELKGRVGRGGLPVLTVNQETGEAQWQIPHHYIERHYNGEMVQFEGRDFSFSVTPDHRSLVQRQKEDTWEILRAEDLVGSEQFKVFSGARGWKGQVPDQIEIPEYQYEQGTNAANNVRTVAARVWTGSQVISLAKLLCYYAAEGSEGRDNLRIYGGHVGEVRRLASELGLTSSVGVDERNGCPVVRVGGGRAWVKFVREQCGHLGPQKRLPRWVLDLPRDTLESLWTQILARTDGGSYGGKKPIYISSSPALLSAVQEILVKIGLGSYCRSEKNLDRDFSTGFQSRHECFRVSSKRPYGLLNKRQKVERVPYSGMVYCVSTENGIVVTRRKGRVWITAQCYMSYGNKAGSKTNRAYVNNLIGRTPNGEFKSGPAHGSVCEHPTFSFLITGAGRGFSHEQVRHRVGWAYSQLSTRYCDFEREDEEGTWDPGFVIPPMAQLSESTTAVMKSLLAESQQSYVRLLNLIMTDLENSPEFTAKLPEGREGKRMLRKAARGAARDILPIATEAIMVMTANARAIWNCIYLRANEHAEGAIRDVYVQLARIMEREMPNLFYGLEYQELWDGSTAVRLPRDKI